MAQPSPGRRLREAVADVTIQIPGAFNALVGRMAEDAGFDAVYLSGAALSAGTLALPDVGLFSLTELATQATYLTRRVEIPRDRRRRHRFRRTDERRADRSRAGSGRRGRPSNWKIRSCRNAAAICRASG